VFALSLQDIAFKLFLFALLVMLLAYFFKQYLQPAFGAYLEKVAHENKTLKDKDDHLAEAKNAITTQLHEQRKAFLLLDEKLKYWHNALLKEQEEAATHNKNQMQRLGAKAMLQTQQLHIEKVQQEVLPRSAQLAHEELKALYAHDNGQELLGTLLDHLKKKVS
jgi:F0F1-type ATP synthase membrane subunit b/b'